MSFDALIVSSLTFLDWKTISGDPIFDFWVQSGCVAMEIGATKAVAIALEQVFYADSNSVTCLWNRRVHFPDFVCFEECCVIFARFELVPAFLATSIETWLSLVGGVVIVLRPCPLPVVGIVIPVIVIVAVVIAFAIVPLESRSRTVTRNCNRGADLNIVD